MKTNSTVQLKSGGPFMIVEGLDNGKIKCVWFSHGLVQRNDFPASMLRQVYEVHEFENDGAITEGDVVKITYYQQAMTVLHAEGPKYAVQYFDERNDLQTAFLSAELLIKEYVKKPR